MFKYPPPGKRDGRFLGSFAMKILSSRFLSLRYFICRILVLFLNCFPQFFILNGFIVVLPAG